MHVEPVGMWTIRAHRPSGETTGTLVLTHNGRALLIGDGTGGGSWHAAGTARFSFRLAEPLVGRDGFRGWIDIDQDATYTDTTFSSSGTSKVYDATGRMTRTASVTISATRVMTLIEKNTRENIPRGGELPSGFPCPDCRLGR